MGTDNGFMLRDEGIKERDRERERERERRGGRCGKAEIGVGSGIAI